MSAEPDAKRSVSAERDARRSVSPDPDAKRSVSGEPDAKRSVSGEPDAKRSVSAERVRLFVALELPAIARSTIAHWGSLALGEVEHARALDPDSLHATLCFLGWRTADEVPAIARACRAVASRRRVVLALGPTRWLPKRQPRVLAVELVDGDGGLTKLQAALSRTLQTGGWYEPEQRPFLAHVTVARFPKGTTVRQPELMSPTPLRFVSDAVTLYRSHTGPGGARYVPLETVGLNG